MKKFGSVLALLAIIAGLWFYLANQFEKTAIQKLLPGIKNNESIILAEPDSIVIEKFKFKIILKNVTILSSIENISVDLLSLFYNPFSSKVTASFNGSKMNIGTDKTAIYIPSPNISVSFNKSLIENNQIDLTKMDVNLTSKDISIYFAADDSFISRAGDVNINFSTKLENDTYLVDYKFKSNETEINPETKYLTHLLDKLISQLQSEEDSNDSLIDSFCAYYGKIIAQTDPINYSSEGSIKLNQNVYERIIPFLQGNKSFDEIYENFDLTKDNYSLSIKDNINNAVIKDSASFYFAGDGEKIKTNVDLSLAHNYTDAQRQSIIPITSDFFNQLMQQVSITQHKEHKNQVTINTDKKIDFTKNIPDDFVPLAKTVDVNNAKIDLNAEYDIKSSDFAHAFNIKLNDFDLKLNGGLKEEIYNGTAEIKTPKLLIDGLLNIYTTGVKPILDKNMNENNADKFEFFDLVMRNIKDNGFAALSAFHNSEALKENDVLKSNFMFNPQKLDFKINDKGFFKILTDKNIVKFLQAMPQDKQKK